MSHDLRQAIGYRRLPTSDPIEEDLRTKWYDARTIHGHGSPEWLAIDRQLTEYLWSRTQRIVAEDRAKHPKAKRNMPVGSALPGSERTGKPEVPHIEGYTAD